MGMMYHQALETDTPKTANVASETTIAITTMFDPSPPDLT